MSTEKCTHPACGCSTREDSEYCSQSCKEAADLTEIACQCGHPGCDVAALDGKPASRVA